MALKMNDTDNGGKKPRRQKPPIWSDGRQAPRFDTAAFLKASTANSRKLAARGLDMATDAVRRAASSFRDGSWRLPPERLGRTGKFLPDHRNIARTLAGTARLTAAAGSWAAGAPEVEPMAFRGWDGQRPANQPTPPPAAEPPRVQRPVRAHRGSHTAASAAVDVDRETLEAIRSVVHAANVMPIRPVRAAAPLPEPEPVPPEPRAARLPDLAPAEPTPPGFVFRAGTAGLGALVIATAWPAGAVQALFAWLRGEDLREPG